MSIENIKKMNQEYMAIAELEDYENDVTLDICNVTSSIISLAPMVGTEADTLTWGEFTRRFNKANTELETLLSKNN